MSNHICVSCNGEGIEIFYDDRLQHHTCYHCNGSGYVDDETNFHDQLFSVAYTLASHHVYTMIQEMDNDPEGDGFCLMAAENGLSHSDYTQHLIDVKTDEFGIELADKPLQEQQLLIAWNNLPVESAAKKLEPKVKACFDSSNYFSNLDSNVLF
jgi:hypothetical protein